MLLELLSIVLLISVILAFIKYKLAKNSFNISTKQLLILFLIKVLFAYGLWATYTYVYKERSQSDIYKYYDDAAILYETTKDKPNLFILTFFNNEDPLFEEAKIKTQHWDRSNKDLFNDNPFIIRLQFLLMFLSFGNIHFHVIFFAFLSFLGSYQLFDFFRKTSAIPGFYLLVLFLFPSFNFWTSGMLKEAIVIFLLGYFLNNLRQVFNPFNLKKGLIVFLMLSGLLMIKTYFILCFLPVVFFLMLKQVNSLKKGQAFALSQITFIVLAWLLIGEKIIENIVLKHNALLELGIKTEAGSLISKSYITDANDLIHYLPDAFLNIFIRPNPFTLKSPFYVLCALENFLFYALICIALIYRKKHITNSTIIYSIVIFCVYYLLVIGLSTPILGALVRYKSIILPFLFILIFSFINFEKLRIHKSFKNVP